MSYLIITICGDSACLVQTVSSELGRTDRDPCSLHKPLEKVKLEVTRGRAEHIFSDKIRSIV